MDYIVIGAGVAGMLTARELARKGASVMLVERGLAGREASWAAGGILSPLYPWRYPDAVTVLARWSQQYYPTLAQELLLETGIDPEYTQNGLLVLNNDDNVEAQAWAERYATPLLRLDPITTRVHEPQLGATPADALWLPDIAQIRSPRYLKAVKRSLLLRGVLIREQTDVTALALDTTPGGARKVAGVITASGKILTDKIILTGGAWSTQLLQGIGLSLPVAPVRGQMILFDASPGLVTRIILAYDHYLIPRRDGRVLAGSTIEHVGFNNSVTTDALAHLRTAATRLIPALAGCPIEHHWSGLRPSSPLGIPFIGPHPNIGNLFINTGQYRNGMALGPASARLLSDMVLGVRPIVYPGPYRLDA